MSLETRRRDMSEKRERLLKTAKAISDKQMTTVDKARFDSIMDDVNAINEEIRRIDTMNEMVDYVTSEDQRRQVMADRLNAVRAEEGLAPIKVESRSEERSAREELRHWALTGDIERRTYTPMTEGSDVAGGYFVPQNFYDKLTSYLKQTDRLFDDSVVTMIPSTNGNVMPLVADDDTSNAASIVSEGNTSSDANSVINRVLLAKAPTWRSGQVQVSAELLQDSFWSIDDVLARQFSVRFQRGIGAANVTTLLGAATNDVTSAGSGTLTPDDLFSLFESLDAAYLSSPKCYWLMNLTTLVSLLKQKAANGQYLLPVRTNDKGEFLIFEKPVAICPSMPTVASSNVPVAFGDMSQFVVRVVNNSLYLRRYMELPGLVENGLFAYQAFMRSNSALLVPAAVQTITVAS